MYRAGTSEPGTNPVCLLGAARSGLLQPSSAGGRDCLGQLPMRFFFNLVCDDQTVPDEVGMELEGLQLAVNGARKAIAEFAADFPAEVQAWDGWRLEITNECGQVLKTFILE